MMRLTAANLRALDPPSPPTPERSPASEMQGFKNLIYATLKTLAYLGPQGDAYIKEADVVIDGDQVVYRGDQMPELESPAFWKRRLDQLDPKYHALERALRGPSKPVVINAAQHLEEDGIDPYTPHYQTKIKAWASSLLANPATHPTITSLHSSLSHRSPSPLTSSENRKRQRGLDDGTDAPLRKRLRSSVDKPDRQVLPRASGHETTPNAVTSREPSAPTRDGNAHGTGPGQKQLGSRGVGKDDGESPLQLLLSHTPLQSRHSRARKGAQKNGTRTNAILGRRLPSPLAKPPTVVHSRADAKGRRRRTRDSYKAGTTGIKLRRSRRLAAKPPEYGLLPI
ncbi:hypothetical protein G6O67_003511 [Ophiocordyceps sinensis]|uniref:Uncharacterized protein n=1 Tax=Ophiocordyceps sinensis TaxID=72228 RepID=A0A8H4PWE3_9HYPO|nr:hypothetical protein G6O67_003511 [Ophiocordyceps sinensis]